MASATASSIEFAGRAVRLLMILSTMDPSRAQRPIAATAQPVAGLLELGDEALAGRDPLWLVEPLCRLQRALCHGLGLVVAPDDVVRLGELEALADGGVVERDAR